MLIGGKRQRRRGGDSRLTTDTKRKNSSVSLDSSQDKLQAAAARSTAPPGLHQASTRPPPGLRQASTRPPPGLHQASVSLRQPPSGLRQPPSEPLQASTSWSSLSLDTKRTAAAVLVERPCSSSLEAALQSGLRNLLLCSGAAGEDPAPASAASSRATAATEPPENLDLVSSETTHRCDRTQNRLQKPRIWEKMSPEEDQMLDLADLDYTENATWPQPCSLQKNRSVELVIGPYVHSIICILGFVGNGLVIATYACYKRTKSMTDVYLLNVAIADLLFVASLPLIVYNELSSWSMGVAACKLLRGSYSVNLYSGTLLLACISSDRYIAIVQARRSFRLRSLAYSRLICAAVWTAALLLSLPTFYFYTVYDHLDGEEVYMLNHTAEDYYLDYSESPNDMWDSGQVCEFRFWSTHTALATKVAVPSTQLAVGFFLPLLIMLLCYSAIILTLLRARNFQRHKAVRVVLVVVLVFILCHLPYNLTLLYDTATMFQQMSCPASDALHVAKTVTQTIAYLHCCLNPVLYAFVGVKFRNHFRRIVQDLWCLGKKYITPRRFSRVTSEIYVSTHRSVDVSSENGSSFTM
ncbi:uncharacterized protein V6R79_003493 [Siganus canaliculatus]